MRTQNLMPWCAESGHKCTSQLDSWYVGGKATSATGRVHAGLSFISILEVELEMSFSVRGGWKTLYPGEKTLDGKEDNPGQT